jgi:hypothetical protein
MKFIAAALALGLAVWYSFVGGKTIDEPQVHDLYASYWKAFDAADGAAICKMYDDAFKGSFQSPSRTVKFHERPDKKAACGATDEFYARKQGIEAAAREELFINTEYTITSIKISPDGKKAVADVETDVRIGMEGKMFFRIATTQTDTIVRSRWTTKFLQSEGVVKFFH